MIRLCVLGSIDLRRDDGTCIDAVLRQPKRFALLAYLASSPSGAPRRRDVVASMFWQDADDRRARDSLSAALSFLRRHVGTAAITTRGEEEVGCDPRHVAADVAEFLRAVDERRDEEVLSLHGGDLLAGFHVQDAPAFEEWLERERARFRALAAESGRRLAQRAAAEGSAEVAASYARRACELAPDDEALLRERIALEASAGNRGAALRAYEDFAAYLATEFNAAPSPETASLVTAIRAYRYPLTAVAPAESAAGITMSAGPIDASLKLEQSPPRSAPGVATRRRLGIRPVAALSVLVTGLVALLGAIARRDPLPARGKVPLIVVADLSSSDTVLGVTAGAWLRSTLSRTLAVRSLQGNELAEALRRMRRDPMRPLDDSVARELAMREGAVGVVSGRITEAKPGYAIHVELVRDDGRVMMPLTATAASSADVPAMLAALADRLRRSVDTTQQSRPALRPVTTPSLDALIAYTEGDRLRYNALNPRAAVSYYERAIQLDSTFAMAYSQLGGAWNELGAAAPSADTIEKLWRTAVRYADALGPREMLAIRDRMIFTQGEPATMFDRAVALYQNHVRLYPEDGPALQSLSWYLKHVGRWADSEAPALQALRTGYATPRLYDELVLAQIAARNFDDAELSVRAWRDRFGPSQLWYRDAFRLAAAKRDYAASDSLTAEAARDRTWNVQPRLLPIATLAIRGRLREAEARYTAAMVNHDRAGDHGPAMRDASWFAVMRASLTGDTAAALGMLREVSRKHFLPASRTHSSALFIYRDGGHHLAMLGDTAGARAMLDRLQDNWYVYRLDYKIRGLIHVAGNRYPEAIAELREVRFTSGHLPALGRAYEAVGAIDSAIAAYERFLVEPDPDAPLWDAVFLIPVLERLGELYSSQGEHGLAAERYELVAELLREADPQLQWRAQRARDRAADARRRIVAVQSPR